MDDDYIILTREFEELWDFWGREKKSQLILLIDIFLLADADTHVYKTSLESFAERNNLTVVEFSRLLSKFSNFGFIEVYKGDSPVRGFTRIYIACRHNEFIDFDGDETYLDLPLISFSQGRKEAKYHKWRNDCLKRDNYQCQHCGSREKLHVHHIKPYAKYPKLATVLSNGITLCQDCHIKEHRRMKNGNL